MKTSTRGFAPSLLVAAMLWSVTTAAPAAEILRMPKSPPGPVLDGVILPPDAAIMLISGQTPAPLDPAKTEGLDDFGNMKTQAASVFGKIKAILERQGYSMKDVVKLTVFVVSDPRTGGLADFAGMNEVYRTFFGTDANPNFPARSSIQIAALGKQGYRIEVEAIAAKASSK